MKYGKDDIRGRGIHANVMSVGPRTIRLRGIFAGLDPRYLCEDPPYRHERRAISATFRSIYGKEAFLEMKRKNKKTGVRLIALRMIEMINETAKEAQ
jgi:hypothetical protein